MMYASLFALLLPIEEYFGIFILGIIVLFFIWWVPAMRYLEKGPAYKKRLKGDDMLGEDDNVK